MYLHHSRAWPKDIIELLLNLMHFPFIFFEFKAETGLLFIFVGKISSLKI